MKRILLSAVIGLGLLGSTGLAQADTSTTSDSVTAAFSQLVMCISGNAMACVSGSGTASPDVTTNPTIVNR